MQTRPLWDGKERAELTNGGVFTPDTHQAPEEPEAEMKGQSYSFNPQAGRGAATSSSENMFSNLCSLTLSQQGLPSFPVAPGAVIS